MKHVLSTAPARLGAILLGGVTALLAPGTQAEEPCVSPGSCTLAEQRALLFERLQAQALTSDQLRRVRDVVERSPVLGQGNPAITVHPMAPRRCREIRERAAAQLISANPVCGSPHMVAMTQTAVEGAVRVVCIDQYEFPNIPCEYPVVHVTAREAVQLCEAVGKRICDAHEWEGACAGLLRDERVEYAWQRSRVVSRALHNAARERIWAYGHEKDHGLCATSSSKSPQCSAGGYRNCGSNTYPAGAFPTCVSPFGVYDQHGNAAEHMNLPTAPEQLASRGGYGFTEMKGSWFIFASFEAHEDDCRWRAPDWHGSAIIDAASHSNYHLGFRCCRTLSEQASP